VPEPLDLYVGYPAQDGFLEADSAFPVLVHVCPPDALVTVHATPNPDHVINVTSDLQPLGPYNRVFQLSAVPAYTPFFLHVRAFNRDHTEIASVVRRLVVKPPPPFEAEAVGAPVIDTQTPAKSTDPNHPVQVNSSFTTAGYVNPTTSTMSSWVLSYPGGARTDGRGIGIACYDWAFYYRGLAPGEYELRIQATSGGQTSVDGPYYVIVP
jgi:hypothetical protein